MNVLHIILTVSKEYGGPVEGLTQSIKCRQKLGQYIEVITLDDPNADYIKEFPCVVNGVGPVNPKFGYQSKIKKWILENGHKFDVAVIHGLWNPTSLEGGQGCKQIGLPYVVFTHGMLDPWFKKAYPLKHLLKQIYWFFQGRVLQNAYRVLFTSSEEERLAKGVFKGYTYTSQVVAYAAADKIDSQLQATTDFKKLVVGIEHKPYLLYLSRIHEKKGCDLLLQAFAKADLREELQLVMAGPCHSDYIDGLKKMAKDLSIADRVHWPGMLKGNLKAEAFYGAEAFVLTSHQENFGIAVAEALAYAKPVLISDQINIWREIKQGNAGFVASDTVDGAVEVLQSWENLSIAEKEKMSEVAREVYESNFTVAAAAHDLTDNLKMAITASMQKKGGES